MRNILIVAACLTGLAVSGFTSGQAPAPDARSETDELRAKISVLERRLVALENRKPAPATSATMPFVIRDENGRDRWEFGLGNNDEGLGLRMKDSKGVSRLSLLVYDDRGSIVISDGKRVNVAWLEGDDEGGELAVKNADGRRVDLDGALGVRVRAKDGNSHVQLSTDGKIGQVNVYESKSGYSVVQLRSISTGAGRLTISNADGSYLLDAGATPSGVGLLKMGPNGNGEAGTVGTDQIASSLQGRKD